MMWKVSWEILWNDPVTKVEYQEKFLGVYSQQECFPSFPRGFSPNIKRGTAYYYSEDAVNYFRDLNDLGFIIRGHECVPEGYLFAMDCKMMTLFSSSNYCGASNEAAICFIEPDKIRIIKIETNSDQK